MSIDGQSYGIIDYYNTSSNGTDGPFLLYSQTGLSNDVHTVNITNLYDPRVNHYGQANVSNQSLLRVVV